VHVIWHSHSLRQLRATRTVVGMHVCGNDVRDLHLLLCGEGGIQLQVFCTRVHDRASPEIAAAEQVRGAPAIKVVVCSATNRMGFYENRMLPFLIDVSMRQATFAEYRRRLVGAATGRVLEVGVGSGLNLPFYDEGVSQIIGLDPSPRLLSKAQRASTRTAGLVELLEGSAEAIPLDATSIDTIVTTWTLCSIPEITGALAEMRRVLKPDGRLLFVEHGRSPNPKVTRWQDLLTPAWKRIAGGCHLNRQIDQLLEGAGFRIERLNTGYMKGPKLMTFMYEGAARVG
jgi:ubiquinone/menaquinone biosynthesis C-methylase UbiE